MKKSRQSTRPGRLRQLQSRTQHHCQSQNQSQNQNDIFCDADGGGVCYDVYVGEEESVGIQVCRLEWGWILMVVALVVLTIFLEWIQQDLHDVSFATVKKLEDSVGFVGVVAD